MCSRFASPQPTNVWVVCLPRIYLTNLCWDQQQGWSTQGSSWSAENMKAMLCICPNLVLVLWKFSLQLVPTKSRYSKFGACQLYIGIWFMELIAQRKIGYKVWWQFVTRYISIYFSSLSCIMSSQLISLKFKERSTNAYQTARTFETEIDMM